MPTEKNTLLIKEKAIDLGFACVGVTTPEPPGHLTQYEAWLEGGFHGEMAYMGDERGRRGRADPKRLFAGCRTVICLGWPYPAMQPEAAAGTEHVLAGLIAAYAWGIDYHLQLAEKMDALCLFIEEICARPLYWRAYTDSAPILERDYAQKAGLGWVGKNTNLIVPRRGSYILLAEILLDIDLEIDDPFTHDRCGNCRLCMDACPTKCILPGRVLDARRCISYLTIEYKGALPPELRPLIGNRIFGCDICQQVCPWNVKFSPPKTAYPVVDLLEEMAMTPAQFRQRYGRTAVARARRRGYLRNVAVALGNTGHAQAAPALETALAEDAEPLVRGHAAWALGRLPGQRVRQALSRARIQESDPYVVEEVQRALEGQ